MIVDAVLYAGERECLAIRCAEHAGLVDRVVVVEGTHTFQGEERRPTPIAELKQIDSRIEQAIYTHWGASVTPFEREAEQRNGIKECVGPGDLVLISDVDEIVRREVLEHEIDNWPGGVVAFDLDQFYYRLNLKDEMEKVLTPRLMRYEAITKPQACRRLKLGAHERMVANAGWHFGWLGDVPRIQKKLESFAHQELNTPELTNAAFLADCIRAKFTLHNGHLLTRVLIDRSFPKLVRECPYLFADLIV